MKLVQYLSLQPELELQQEMQTELTQQDRDAVERAIQLWTTKPIQTCSINLKDLKKLLSPASSQPAEAMPEGDLVEKFVFVSPRELSELDPEEKVASLIGEGIFMNEQVPKEYLPLVILNLSTKRRAVSDNRIVQIFQAAGASIDMAQHWSANLVDVVAAERFFSDDKQLLQRYLKWRKQVERTAFFEHPLIAPYFEKKLHELNFRRTVHPAERGQRSEYSWALSGLADSDHRFDRVVLDLGVSKTDLIFRRFASEKNFAPDAMMRLLKKLEQSQGVRHFGTRYFGRGRDYHCIDLSYEPELQRQAFLLTEAICGEDCAILAEAGADKLPETYVLRPSSAQTMRALCDRIAYFTRQTLLKRMPDPLIGDSLLRLLRFTNEVALQTLPYEPIEVDMRESASCAAALDKLAAQQKLIEGELGKTAKLLDRYAELEGRIRVIDQSGARLIPASITESRGELESHRSLLAAKEGELDSFAEVLRIAEEIRRDQGALLANIDLGERPAGKKLLKP